MKRPVVNFIVDWFGFVLISLLVGTGLLLHFRLPPGSGSAHLAGLTRHEWGEVHFWIAMGLSVVVALHLILHAKWIQGMTVGGAKGVARTGRAWVGIVAASAMVVIAAAPLFWPVAPNLESPRNGQVAGRQAADHDGDGAGDGRGEGQGRRRRQQVSEELPSSSATSP